MIKRKEPQWLLTEAVLAMHKMLVSEHGGATEVRDLGLLESALARPKNLFEHEDPKPSLARLASSYAFGIAKNHAFVDGNKRVALTASAVFLEINGQTLIASEAETVIVFENLAAGRITETKLADWFKANVSQIRK